MFRLSPKFFLLPAMAYTCSSGCLLTCILFKYPTEFVSQGFVCGWLCECLESCYCHIESFCGLNQIPHLLCDFFPSCSSVSSTEIISSISSGFNIVDNMSFLPLQCTSLSPPWRHDPQKSNTRLSPDGPLSSLLSFSTMNWLPSFLLFKHKILHGSEQGVWVLHSDDPHVESPNLQPEEQRCQGNFKGGKVRIYS